MSYAACLLTAQIEHFYQVVCEWTHPGSLCHVHVGGWCQFTRSLGDRQGNDHLERKPTRLRKVFWFQRLANVCGVAEIYPREKLT